MKNKKIMFISMFIVMTAIMLIPGKVHAAYQSKPNSTVITENTSDNFFVGCRNMETSGGVLGLKEVLAEDYTGTTSNGIDSHMILNTEWGTIALLTDSTYGVGKNISGTSNTNTSTGNTTGIYDLANDKREFAASSFVGASASCNSKMRNAEKRYFNYYEKKESKPGDAIDCSGWLSASNSSWIQADAPIFLRGASGLFGYHNGRNVSIFGEVSYSAYSTTRAVVVCGAGL